MKIQKENGITLVALVITIIILLILAGITISQLTGSGLFENAKLAEQKSKEVQEKENSILDDYESKIDKYLNGNSEVAIEKITFDNENVEVEVGKTQKIPLTLSPAEANSKNVQWSSSNPNVATVNQDGMVTGVSAGETIIKVETKDGSGIKAECKITIKEPGIEIIYSNGWVNPKFGEMAVITNTENNSIAEFNSDHIFCATSSRCSYNNAKIGTVDAIDLSNYETLVIEVICTEYKEGNFGVCVVDKNNKDSYLKQINVKDGSDIVVNEKFIIECDISSITEGHPAVHYTYDKFKVLKMYLVEKKPEEIEYIYDNGTVNSKFGELALITNTENNSIAEFNSDHIFCATSSRCSYNNAKIGTVNAIDLSDYKKLAIEVICTQYQEGNFGVCVVDKNNKDTFLKYINANNYSDFAVNEKFIIELDISALTSEGHVATHYTYDKYKLLRMYLVKK